MPKLIISLDALKPSKVQSIIAEISQNTQEYKQDILYKFNDMIALIWFQGIAELVKDYDIRLMLDPKWNDIPNTIVNYLTQLHASGLAEKVDVLTIHANAWEEVLKAAVQTKNTLGLKLEILAITSLTSQDKRSTEVIYDEDPTRSVLKLTKLALDSWVDGVVCSWEETPVLREVFGEGFRILNPWVRFVGGEVHDQKRVVSPQQAIKNWVNYVVMGRPILEADDMSAAVKRFFEETRWIEYQGNTWKYTFERLLYTGDWKEILSYIGAFYFRPEWGKYVRFTSKVISNAYINIWEIERNYLVVERACRELASQIQSRGIEADYVVWAQMGSVRISLYLAEKLSIEESIYTEKDSDNMMDLKRHAVDLRWKRVILSEDIVSRGTTIAKMREVIEALWGKVVAIACVWNRYEQDQQEGIPIISCFIPPKFELFWDDVTPIDQRKDFPKIPEASLISEKPKNQWEELVESMRK